MQHTSSPICFPATSNSGDRVNLEMKTSSSVEICSHLGSSTICIRFLTSNVLTGSCVLGLICAFPLAVKTKVCCGRPWAHLNISLATNMFVLAWPRLQHYMIFSLGLTQSNPRALYIEFHVFGRQPQEPHRTLHLRSNI